MLAGHRKRIPHANPEGRRINALTALVVTADAASLVWVTPARTLHADDFAFFLNQALPDPLGRRVVVLNNAPPHRNRTVAAARRALRDKDILLYCLSPYRPELNAIEMHLGVVKHHEMPERTYWTLPSLSDAIDAAFAKVEVRLTSNR